MFLKILVSNLDLQGLREIIKRPYWMVCGLFLFLFFSRCCFYIQCGLKNYFLYVLQLGCAVLMSEKCMSVAHSVGVTCICVHYSRLWPVRSINHRCRTTTAWHFWRQAQRLSVEGKYRTETIFIQILLHYCSHLQKKITYKKNFLQM